MYAFSNVCGKLVDDLYVCEYEFVTNVACKCFPRLIKKYFR